MGGSSSKVDQLDSTSQYMNLDGLTKEMLIKGNPEFFNGLQKLTIESLTMKIDIMGHQDDLDNAGSEMGCEIRRLHFEWDENNADKKPKTAIAKTCDINDVPAMNLLKTNSLIKRFIIKKVVTKKDPDHFTWTIPSRVINAEYSVYDAVHNKLAESHVFREALPKLYLGKTGGGKNFPGIDKWTWKGAKSIPKNSLWTMLVMEDMKGMWSAEGPTSIPINNGLEKERVLIALEELALLHASNWMKFKETPLTDWITKCNPGSNKMVFWYVMTFGLWPEGVKLPNFGHITGKGDEEFAKAPIEKWVSEFGSFFHGVFVEKIDVLSKLQKRLPAIQKEICPCSFEKCQTVLHGDAHAWNMFWASDDSDQATRRYRIIDFQNCGAGRASWEVLYFLSRSTMHNWENLEIYLKHYYEHLLGHVGENNIGMSFSQFRREYHFLALNDAIHMTYAAHYAKKFKKKQDKKLRRASISKGRRGSEARKMIEHATCKVKNVLSTASDILDKCGDEYFANF